MATVEPDMGAPEHPAEGLGDLGAASDQVRRASSTTGRWSEYTQLSRQIKRAGLLDRRRGWYLAKVAVNGALLAAGGTAFLLLGDSWWQLLTAAYLAVVFTQIAFMGHDAGHR
jgi:fatty acid desaturase